MSDGQSNVNQAPGCGDGHPNAPPADSQPAGPGPANDGLTPGGQSVEYAPVPQITPYGETSDGGGYGPAPVPGKPRTRVPIVKQPRARAPPAMGSPGEWMKIPDGITNCPRGLEYLTNVNQLLVKQKVERLESFTGFETNNKFSIRNPLGQKVYYAVEDNDCCSRNSAFRPFEMKIFDGFRHEVIHLSRPMNCSACCFPCCLQTMEVSAPPGTVIGSIAQEWSICTPMFRINNHMGETVMRIEGPVMTFSMCGDVDFEIMQMTGQRIGRISKKWSGFGREIFTDADFFGITFPLNLDASLKAVLLGATFLIDAMFFEKSGSGGC